MFVVAVHAMDNVNEDDEEVTTFGATIETQRTPSYIETAALNIANVSVEIEEKKPPPVEVEEKTPPEVSHDSHGDDKK